jgi:tryptophan synthase alpha chain
MTNRIDNVFTQLRQAGQSPKALMPFVCGGFPRPGMLKDVLQALEIGGASIVEIGMPFSDPIADGPIIAAAMHEALASGVTPASVLSEISEARRHTSLGLVAMVSISIVQRMGGAQGFAQRAADAGLDGLIVPDAPLDEASPLRDAADKAGLAFSLLIAPSTSKERAERIVQACTGFVYLLTRAGTTGERSAPPEVAQRVAALRTMTSLPIACGFGISTAEHVAAVVAHADAAIVGSAIVKRMSEAARQKRDVVQALQDFTAELAKGLRER